MRFAALLLLPLLAACARDDCMVRVASNVEIANATIRELAPGMDRFGVCGGGDNTVISNNKVIGFDAASRDAK